ncbi:hypothetical protein KFE25_013448 [Diacronema lutheri]|uniref:Neurotransmitter-gated ion-channel ligand-binding domain-containing protein n=1 Tax=Diacronema lutheri TaxID=2081491 RepID=A0A8J6CFU3_DIALT|nr:hypothetical protein KFE25_013448 [Diacronema lutheri]
MEVGMSWELILESINDADEQFSVELDLKYTWIARGFARDWKAAGSPAANTPEMAELVRGCWDPKLRIANVADREEVASDFTLCLDPSQGRMHRYTKIRLTCSETLELHRFPFDRQLLAIQLTTYRDTNEVVFVPYEGRSSLNKSRAGRWKLHNGPSPLFVVPSTDSRGLIATSGRAYHRAFITIEAERDANWYITHFILPHCVIIAMNVNVTLISRNEVADRNSVTLTLLLTAVAFQFLLVSEVPKKNYQTILDWVMATGLAVQLVTCLLVFLNADNPHNEEWDRSAFYSLTDANVFVVELVFSLVFIVPWVAGNLLLVTLAKCGLYAASFDRLVQFGQGWLQTAMGEDEHGSCSGTYTLIRSGKARTASLVRFVKDGASSRTSAEPILAA